MIVSDFIIEAENLKEANKIAQSHKRLERLKGRTRVKKELNKMVEKIIISYMRGYSSATTSPEIGKPF